MLLREWKDLCFITILFSVSVSENNITVPVIDKQQLNLTCPKPLACYVKFWYMIIRFCPLLTIWWSKKYSFLGLKQHFIFLYKIYNFIKPQKTLLQPQRNILLQGSHWSICATQESYKKHLQYCFTSLAIVAVLN